VTARFAVREALAVAVYARIPIVLKGGPGIGKTSLFEQVGDSMGAHVEVMVLAQMDPTELTGVMFVDSDGITRTAVPAWVERVNAHNPSLVFFDEFLQASPLHQGVANDVIQGRRVGAVPLAEHVRFVAAYNPPERYGGFEFSRPTQNRFIDIEVVPDPDVVAEGLVTGWPDAPLIEPTDVDKHLARWLRTVAAFVKARPGCLSDTSMAASGPFATPRSLEMAAKAAAIAEAAGVSDEARNLLIAGAVGPGVGHELIAYSRELDLPDPDVALSQPDSVVIPDRSDRAWACLMSIVDVAVRRNEVAAWRAAWTILGRAVRVAGVDVAALAARRLVIHQPPGATPPPEVALFTEAMAP
jgi:MoxR-like ATPase